MVGSSLDQPCAAARQLAASNSDTISQLSWALASNLSQKNTISCISVAKTRLSSSLMKSCQLWHPVWCLAGSWEGLQVRKAEPPDYTWGTMEGASLPPALSSQRVLADGESSHESMAPSIAGSV